MSKVTIFAPNEPMVRPMFRPVKQKWGGKPSPIDPATPIDVKGMAKDFSPQYLFEDGFKPVSFERTRYWPELKIWVCVFRAEVFCTKTYRRWTERYIWASGFFGPYEVKQFGGSKSWRQSRKGWK